MQYFSNDGMLHGVLRVGKNLRDYREHFKAAMYFGELKVDLNPITYQPEITLEGQWTSEVPAHLSWHNEIKSSVYFEAWHEINSELNLFWQPGAQQKWPSLFLMSARERVEIKYDHHRKYSGETFYGTKIWKAVLESDFTEQTPMIPFPDYVDPYRGF